MSEINHTKVLNDFRAFGLHHYGEGRRKVWKGNAADLVGDSEQIFTDSYSVPLVITSSK